MAYQAPINANLRSADPSIPTNGLGPAAYASFKTIGEVQKNVNIDVLQAIADLASGNTNPLMEHVVSLAGHVSALADHVSSLAGHVGTMAGHLESVRTGAGPIGKANVTKGPKQK
jgi:hypothetical protein